MNKLSFKVLDRLLEAKGHSDRKQYDRKTAVMRQLIRKDPGNFKIDSEKDGVVGVTHVPTNFKMHLLKKDLTDLNMQKAAQAGLAMRELLGGLGIGAAATGIPMAAWYSQQQPSDPEARDPATGKKLTNVDVWKARQAVNQGFSRLKNEDFDVPADSGLDRVMIPDSRLKTNILKYLNFSPSIVAVPEAGQDSMTTYRQTGTHGHLHHHPGGWYLHRDVYPALSMAMKEVAAGNKDMGEALTEGVMHPAIEGTIGWKDWLKNWIRGDLTYDEVMKAKTQPDKYPELVKRYNTQLMSDNEAMMKKLRKEQAAQVPMKVKTAALNVEIADTPELMVQGLSFRKELPSDRGMLFTKAGHYWMKDVHFPLDIMFLSKNGSVVDIQHMAVEQDKANPARMYSPRSPVAEMALEVPGGWCTKNNIEIGDTLLVNQGG